ncbi:MAG: hypothetical protein IJV08_04690 [Bacteroidaceae bacterium]|nr:hypothetical protein [Bacteroidaceae bacterium]
MKRFTSLLIATFVALIAFAQTGRSMEGLFQKRGLMRRVQTTTLPTAKGERMARPAKAPAVVVAPDGLVAEEYSIVSTGYEDEEQTGSVYVGFDGQDVYIQGLCSYLPEAWVKGQLNGTTATFAADQYLGNFSGYDIFFQEEEATFEYDAESARFATDELVYTYFDEYYADYYDHPVITKVVEKAVMPANPSVIGVEEDSDYGYYIHFNVPATDAEGNGLAASKLSYQFFTDVDGTVAPLVFTPATHVKLTENLSVIPFGFTEGYDFYNGTIYLNELYSETWDRLGIKSIYTGGGETHETEIQWTDLAGDDQGGEGGEVAGEATFDFNSMDVATSSSNSTDGDITEALDITEDLVTLTISPKDEGVNTQNRFWSTSGGPQLRVYSGTLTFSVPEGYTIGQIVFNYGKWNDGNSADSGSLSDGTWKGNAQTVVISVAGNSQINSIVVTVLGQGGGEGGGEMEVVEAPEDLVTETYLMTAYDDYFEEDVQRTVQVGFYGENEVYIQGLSEYVEEAWVKGTLEGGVLSIPETYLGTFTFLFDEYELTLPATEFQYDSENGRFVLEEGFYTTDGEYAYDDLQNVVISQVKELEATPADPEVTNFVLYSKGEDGTLSAREYPYVSFHIPALDTEARPMVVDKLSYEIYVEAQNGGMSPLTLTTDLYTELPESLTEIPFSFTDEYDIQKGGSLVYLNQGFDNVSSWKKIGVQSIYRGMGVEHRSAIGWFDIEAYIQEVLSAVNSVASDETVVRYFDLQGRVARAGAKGLLIKQVRDSQGNVRNVKTVRK